MNNFQERYTCKIFDTVMFAPKISIIFIIAFVPYHYVRSSDEVCFDAVGCYSQLEPWISLQRPFPPPESPETVNVSFRLFTRRASQKLPENFAGRIIKLNSGFKPCTDSLRALDYDSKRTLTVFIIHGFASDTEVDWIREMISAFLDRVDGNVIAVDWQDGAKSPNYLQAASNTRVVASIISNFLKHLVQKNDQNLGNVHFIGHSLGAHIMGYVGKSIPDIQRGTALDPAQPGFEEQLPEVRLHQSDFLFLDVIHTNGKKLGLGYKVDLGHVDFYFNGGEDQPGCLSESLDLEWPLKAEELLKLPGQAVINLITCSHSRSSQYLIEAIKRTDCIMWGHQINDSNIDSENDNLLENTISTCDLYTCSPVGIQTPLFPGRGSFFVKTASKAPFCVPEVESTEIMKHFQPVLNFCIADDCNT